MVFGGREIRSLLAAKCFVDRTIGCSQARNVLVCSSKCHRYLLYSRVAFAWWSSFLGNSRLQLLCCHWLTMMEVPNMHLEIKFMNYHRYGTTLNLVWDHNGT